MKEEYIDQHITPKRYLQRFAAKGKKGYQIGVWQKGKGSEPPRVFVEKIDNVGYIKRFYDVSTRADKKYWEKYYATHIDPLYGKHLDNVIARVTLSQHERFCLTSEEKNLLAKIVCSQMLRVPKVLTANIEKAPQLLANWKDEFLEAYKGRIPRNQEQRIRERAFTKDEIKDIILEHITDEKSMNQYVNALRDRLWLIYINNTHFPFITCDSPVLQYNLWGNSIAENDTGIARLDTALILALTPRIMLHLLPRSFRTGTLEDYNGKLLILDERNLRFISNYNKLQLENCYQQAFMSFEMLELIQAGEQFVKEQNNNLG